MENLKIELLTLIKENKIAKIVFSSFRKKEEELEKVICTPVEIKNKRNYQFEYRYKRILKHKNIAYDNEEIQDSIESLLENARDINIYTETENIACKISKKYKILINRKSNNNKIILSTQNKKKNYIIDANEKYNFLIELGIQSNNGKIKSDKYNKFKQINKYLEFIDSSIKKLPNNKTINILDFGSGKSYLTFATYYYLKTVLKLDVRITGIDLKKEVIDSCNKLAKKLEFNNLNFQYGDVINFNTNEKIDVVISLHACDIATDIALLKAINWQAKIILAVPCCQKEISKQIKKDFLPVMLKHGIIKEKFSTLLTDSVRSEVLSSCGYESSVIEFIEETNTPKNVMIRAFKKQNKIEKEKIKNLQEYLKTLNVKMFLIEELLK